MNISTKNPTALVLVAKSTALVLVAKEERQLATIKTVDEAKKVRDQAEILRQYAKLSNSGLRDQNRYALIKFLAERRGGEILAAIPRQRGAGGGRPRKKEPDQAAWAGFTDYQAAITEAGISTEAARVWQLFTNVTESDLHDLAAACDGDGVELTRAEVLVVAKGERQRTRGRATAPGEAATSDLEEEEEELDPAEVLSLVHLTPKAVEGFSYVETQAVLAAVRNAFNDLVKGDGTINALTDSESLKRWTVEALHALAQGKIGHGAVLTTYPKVMRLFKAPAPTLSNPTPTRPLPGWRIGPTSPLARLERAAEIFISATSALHEPHPTLCGEEKPTPLSDPERQKAKKVIGEVRVALAALLASLDQS